MRDRTGDNMPYCLYCQSFDHSGATCAKRLKALAEHEADWKAFSDARQAFYESLPVEDSKPRGQSRTAHRHFSTPEARAAYFDELGEARQDLDAITSKGTVLQTASEPDWMRAMTMDERIHDRQLTEL